MSRSKRIIIYPKDIQQLFGKSDRTARRLMASIRVTLNKPRKGPITVREFCAFMNLDEQQIASYLTD